MRNNPKLLPSKMRIKSDDAGASITEILWFCENCCLAKKYEKDTPQVKLFLVYVDDIEETLNVSQLVCSMPQSSLHPKLQFKLKETNSEGSLLFLELNINMSQG